MRKIMIVALCGVILAAVSVCRCEAQTLDDYLKVARDAKADKAKRNEAIRAIGALPDRDKAVPELLQCLRDGQLYQTATAALTQTDVVRQLSAQLKDPAAKDVVGNLTQVIRVGIPGAVDECAKQLSAPEYIVRFRALSALASIRSLQQSLITPVVPALVERATKDANILIRLDALRALGSFGPHTAGAIPALVELLKSDPSAEIRVATAQALGGFDKPEAIAALAEALGQENDDVRYAAALSLSGQGKASVSALTAAVAGPSAAARRYAAFALAKIGKDAAPAVPALTQALKDKDDLVRRNAADALGRVADKAVVADLQALVSDPSREVRLAVAGALKSLGGDDPAAQDAVRRIEQDKTAIPGYLAVDKDRPPPADGSGILFPEDRTALYATHHGEPAGYPGCIPGELNDKGEPKYPAWGNPELQPYPGSVEHYRTEQQKYLPLWMPFNVATLLKNFRATELPEARGRIEDYAEPVYYTPMYGQSRDTDKRNPPVKVVRARVGQPAFPLDLGTLDVGLYVVRAIGVVPENPTGYRKPLYFDFQVNDQAADPNAMTRYRLRVGYVDEFYSLAEFYFYAPEKRAFRAVLSVGDRSEVEPLLYNFDLHDAWHGVALRPIKTRMTLRTPAEVDARRAEYARLAAAKKAPGFGPGAWGHWSPLPASLPPEERIRRDRDLWEAFPPINRNYGPGYTAEAIAGDDGWRDAGGPLGPLSLRNDVLGLRYTYQDFLAERALPDPYPRKDDGGGLYLPLQAGKKYPEVFMPIARAVGSRMNNYQSMVCGLENNFVGLADIYQQTGDPGTGRDAAFMLCRLAYAQPTVDAGRQELAAALAGNSTDLQWGGKDHWTRRRLNRIDVGAHVNIAQKYDMLFDCIHGNQELAAAVGGFVPWVKTPDDVVAFLDSAVQNYVKRLVAYHYHADFSTAVIGECTELGDWPFTKPWMQWVFTKTWAYPNARAGEGDYAITSTNRDGTSYIGSWMYAGDRPAREDAKLTQQYVAAGGYKEYDLSDPRAYPKAVAGCTFDIEGRAAGLYALCIGDVGGPNLPYNHWFNYNEPASRLGWQWTHDPKFAYILANYFQRKGESEAEWAQIEQAAQTAPNPWFANRSRVLSAWAGILEAGVESLDFRFRRAAMIRLGYGWGHQHDDTLDMILYAHGVIHASDGGERPEKRSQDEVKGPADQKSYVHDVVEVDGTGSHRTGNWRGHSWARAMKDAPGARYLDSASAPAMEHLDVDLFRRQTVLVDVNEGTPAKKPPVTPKEIIGKLDPDVVAPDAYVFDVFRVAGGKRHTYCFHGCEADEFKTNATGVRPVPWEDNTSPEGLYLKNFICPDLRTAGTAPAVLDASWRLRRATEPIRAMRPVKDAAGKEVMQPVAVYTTHNTERENLGENYDPNAPRKFTRLLLFGQEGARVLTGQWIASAPAVTMQCLFAQRDAPAGQERLESAFPAVIEMYAGRPVIQEAKLLAAAPNETDALRAAAVELRLPDERVDVCFADGRPEKVRALENGVGVSGEFAYYSKDRAGLRQATLVGGTQLGAPGVSIEVAARERQAKIVKADYLDKKVWIDQPWPALLLDGQAAEIGMGKHRTSYMIRSVQPAEGGAVISFDKGMDYLSAPVIAVDAAKSEVTTSLGFPTDDGAAFPGLSDDLVVSNGAGTKFWRGQYLGGTREEGYRFRLQGAATQADFGLPAGKLRVWEIGVGDTVRIPTHASLRRAGAGRYELRADTAVQLKLTGAGKLRISSDGKTWKDLPAGADGRALVGEADLARGVVSVEPGNR